MIIKDYSSSTKALESILQDKTSYSCSNVALATFTLYFYCRNHPHLFKVCEEDSIKNSCLNDRNLSDILPIDSCDLENLERLGL